MIIFCLRRFDYQSNRILFGFLKDAKRNLCHEHFFRLSRGLGFGYVLNG
jgi:hypothetical protein